MDKLVWFRKKLEFMSKIRRNFRCFKHGIVCFEVEDGRPICPKCGNGVHITEQLHR